MCDASDIHSSVLEVILACEKGAGSPQVLRAESTLSSLVRPNRSQKVDLAKFRPVNVKEDKFAVSGLPQ